MICMFWKRAFVIRFLVVFVLSSVFDGTNALCVIRGDVDAFSNPDAVTCSRVGCTQVHRANGCKSRINCCMCQCRRDAPNYLIHRNACVPNDELGDCDFTCTSSEVAVVDLSKAGKLQFEGDPERCFSGLVVAQWSYRLNTPQEIKGQPNNFIVKARGWSNRWSLQWKTGLDAKYSGLILKFDLACASNSGRGYARSQCLLVKSKGNYTRSEAPSNPPVEEVPSDVAVDVHATGGKVEPTGRTERNDTQPVNINNVRPGETAADTENKGSETEGNNNSVVVVSVCLSLVAGVALVCVLVLRRSGSTRSKGRRNAEARDKAYEEPVDPANRYVGVKRNSRESFQNEFYDTDCVLSIEGPTAATNKTCRLGPLPPLPSEEGIYEEPMISGSVGYHGLAQDPTESSEQTKDELEIKEEPSPVYNTLEPPSDADEDDYDDTVKAAIEEEPPPVYNTLEPPSVDEDDYDDTIEPASQEEPPPVYNTLEPPSDDEDGYDDTAEPAYEEPPPVYNTLEPPSDDEDCYDDTAEPASHEELPPVYNTLEPPSDDEDGYDDTAESRCHTV